MSKECLETIYQNQRNAQPPANNNNDEDNLKIEVLDNLEKENLELPLPPSLVTAASDGPILTAENQSNLLTESSEFRDSNILNINMVFKKIFI